MQTDQELLKEAKAIAKKDIEKNSPKQTNNENIGRKKGKGEEEEEGEIIDETIKIPKHNNKPIPMQPRDRMAGNWIASYLKYAAGQESPELFHTWIAVSVISSVLRRNVVLKMGYFEIYPNHYTILVSPSGTCRKGVAIGMGSKFLREIDDLNLFRSKLTPEFLMVYLKKSAVYTNLHSNPRKEGTPYQGEDAKTREQLRQAEEESGESLRDMHEERCEATILAPELSTMLGTAAYAEDLRKLLTDLYDCKADPDEYGTKHGGHVKIHNVCLNFIGASNPTWLAKSVTDTAFGGGFMGRVIFVYQNVGKTIPWPEKSPEILLLEKLMVLDLQHISKLRGSFRVTQSAKDFVGTWYRKFVAPEDDRMSGYYERKQFHLLKLAMILSISHSDSLVIRQWHCKLALKMLKQIEDWMPDAFAFIGSTLEAQIEHRIVDYMRAHKGYASSADLLRFVRKDLPHGKRQFDSIMHTLVSSSDVVSWISKKNSKVYYIFKDVLAVMQKQAIKTAENSKKVKEKKKEEEEEEKKGSQFYY